MVEAIFNGLENVIVPLGICVLLPIAIVWLAYRRKMNETNKRTEIVLAAIEKNSGVDVEEFLKKLNPPQKTMRENLLSKLQRGCVFLFVGIGCVGYMVYTACVANISEESILPMTIVSVLALSIGGANLITYFVGKNQLGKD